MAAATDAAAEEWPKQRIRSKKEKSSVQRATNAEGWQKDHHGQSRISWVESAEARDDTTICCAMVPQYRQRLAILVGAGGWCQWACIPVIRALHLVAAGYLQECERRTRSARLKALVLGNASRASSAVLSFVAYYVDCRPVAQLRPLLKPPPLHFIHASSSSSEAETARRRLCCPSFISHSLCFSQPAEKKADREFSRSLSPEWKTEKHS